MKVAIAEISSFMTSVAKGEVFGFAATAGPDRTVFLHLEGVGRLAGSFVGAVTVRRVFRLPAGAEVKGLTGLGVDFVGEGLPAHEMIIVPSR